MLAGLLLAACARPEVFLTEARALEVAFGASAEVAKELVAFTREQREEIARAAGREEAPRIFRYFAGRKDGVLLGYAVIEDCLGKSEPITYMVSTDAAGSVRSVEILAYRESHGGEVRQAGWRKQFVGRDASSPLRVGTNVRNIAGATISCRSVTDGVRLQLACLRVATRDAPKPKAPREGPLRRSRLAMGTTLTISAFAESDAAIGAAFAEVDRLERRLSTFRVDSDASRVNLAAGGEFQPVGPELLDVVARAHEWSSRTGGAFDVAVGPLVALWKRPAIPSDAEIEAARGLCGSAAIETDPEHGRMRLARAGAALDLGAIGKGYALDRAAAVLEERGVARALLDFGGQFLALDPPPGEDAWKVELRDARDPGRTRGALRLVRASLSTTADYERGLAAGDRRISHVVDPRTGRPVEGMLGASVVCVSATEADALSTALYVLGADEGAELARRRGFAALLVPGAGPEIANDAFRALEVPR